MWTPENPQVSAHVNPWGSSGAHMWILSGADVDAWGSSRARIWTPENPQERTCAPLRILRGAHVDSSPNLYLYSSPYLYLYLYR